MSFTPPDFPHHEPVEPESHEVSEPALTPRQEIERLISTNDGRMGDVYRLSLQQGLSAEQVAEQLNVATQNFVYTYRYQIDAALDGKTTSGSVLRRQAVSALNNLVKRGRTELSPEAMRLLLSNKAAVEASGVESDALAQAEADTEADDAAATTLEQLKGIPGIYAFSYGWYLESLVDPERGNTLIKVGLASDVASRISQYTSGIRTHMPEPLALVRVYAVESAHLNETEKMFHELLENAGHSNPRRAGKSSREVGKEWFLTNEDFLDSVAKALRLRTLYLGRSEFGGD